MMLSELYHEYFVQRGDARVANWFLMKDPILLILILVTYLYTIFLYLPLFMKNRKAYDLKIVLRVYNVLQIIVCAWTGFGMLTSGWTTTYTLGCQPVDYSNDPSAVRLLTYIYISMVTKLFDLLETVFFLLRNKHNQVTKLHVYHHCVTPILNWIVTKYIGGGMSSFGFMLNSFIHVLMYTYYLLASMGPDVQKKIDWFKPKLTLLQMVQFWVIVIHGMQVLKPDCDMPNLAAYVILPNVVVIFGFFLNFYLKRYLKNK